ncbi:MAG: glycosyltransferase family 4 protein [Acidobacteria bacterium]|nr:glycosyltransferase family 4 protein [Acidobacteriota bacterium]
MPVKVALDIRRVNDFGVGTYIRNIVRGLAAVDSSTEYFLLGPPRQFSEFQQLPRNFTPVPFAPEEESARSLVEFRRTLKHLQCDVVHVPHLFRFPRRTPCPYVITVHDLLASYHAPDNGSGLSRLVHGFLIRRALEKSERILAVSKFTRNELGRIYGVGPGKVSVVYNAIDERFRRGHASQADRQMIVERYRVTYPYLLYAGNIKPHKNVTRIIEAFSALKSELEKEGAYPDLKLVIIGDELSKHPDLRRTVVKGAVQNDVRFLGFVPIDVLRVFYDLAKVFVFPSLYEGFGLPPLEAMAHGTPVVASNATSLPEVVGNAAVVVNPENSFEIMRAVHRVLLDQPLREELKQRGYRQVQQFSWEEAARRTLEVYRGAAEGSSG